MPGELIVKHSTNAAHRGKHPVADGESAHGGSYLDHAADLLVTGNHGEWRRITFPPRDIARYAFPAQEGAFGAVAYPRVVEFDNDVLRFRGRAFYFLKRNLIGSRKNNGMGFHNKASRLPPRFIERRRVHLADVRAAYFSGGRDRAAPEGA